MRRFLSDLPARLRIWLAELIAPKGRSLPAAKSARMVDLMERRMREIEGGRLPTAYDPRIEEGRPWTH